MLNCLASQLLLIYLGVLLSGNQPRKQDWTKLTLAISNRLFTWKTRILSLGGCIVLINFVLFALPISQMFVFELPKLVQREIDMVRSDFLQSSCDIPKPKCRLAAQSQICKSKDQGGWGILNLADFNLTLLGKWWWKFQSYNNPVWSEIIVFNYMPSGGLITLLHSTPKKKSFFWKGLFKCRAAFVASIESTIKDGEDISFWSDRWLEGCIKR